MEEQDLDADPVRQFHTWFEQARATEPLPEACALATATSSARPSVRMVLAKGLDAGGFVFYTGYESRKGWELLENPHAALCFYWNGPGRQVRIEGPVERVSSDESDAYFASRPLGSRLSAAVSRQSEVAGTREELEAAVEELRALHGAEGPERPPIWGGFRLIPQAWEFWQHRDDRLHDRFRYLAAGADWLVERLYP